MQVGRNDPCPCGSGKKYKKCCMKKDNVVQLKELKRDHFLQEKLLLQKKMQDFLEPCLSFSEENRLRTQFKQRMDSDLDQRQLDIFFSIWLNFFHVYENGKRGVEWFYEHEQKKLDPRERAMAKQWTTLQPGVFQVVDKNEDGIWAEDYFSKERYFLPFAEMLTDLPPWATTFCMIERANDEYFVHGGAPWQGPEFLEPLSEKINQLVEETGNPLKQVVMDYFPEIFSVLIKDPSGERDNDAEQIESITLSYHMNDKEKVVDQLFDHPQFVVDEWADGEGSFDWMEKWYRYEDSEAPDPVYLGQVNGTIEVKNDTIKFQTNHAEDAERFQTWIGNLSAAVIFNNKSVETIDVPRKVEFHTLRVQMSEETPQYFATIAQSRYYQDLDRAIPMFGNRSPKELVQNGKEKSVDLWLKQHEYVSYLNLRKQFGTTVQTDDFNSARKELGLPLSPFVTGGKERHSSIHPCENPLPRSNRVKK